MLAIKIASITLADGSTQKALVPKVYTRQAVGQIDGTGSLIAAKNLVVNVTGDVNNQGLLVGHNTVNVKALNLTNENGGVIAGDYLQLNTANDLTNKSLIKAGSAANLEVGGNFNNQSDTYSTSSTKGLSSGSRTGISQLATIYVGDALKGQTDKQGNPLITFNANVGGNTTFDAGVLNNQGGSTRINTAGDTNLNAVNTGYQTNAIGDANNYFKQGKTRDIGSQITGADDITIQSGGMVTGKALQVNSSGGDISLQGTKGVKLTAGHQTDNLSTANTYKEDKWYGDKKISQKFNATSDTAVTSDLKANNISINSEQGDVSLIGGNANAKGRADVTAMNGKVTIESVVDSHTQSSSKSTENFYKETAKQKGFEKETLNQTGVTGSSVYINGQNVAINAANVQAKDGTLQIGDATLATDDSGNLKLDDNGKPIVLTGSIDNLDLGTIELENREWDEKQKGYKGIAKGVMQVAGAVGGALGITDGITIGKSQGHNTTSTSEEVTTLEGSNVLVGGNTVNAKGTQITATAEDAQAVVLGNNIDLGVATTAATTNDYEQKEVVGGEGMKFTNDSLQLGAIVRTDSKDSTTTTTNNQGVSINSDNITVLGGMEDGSLTTTAAKFNANTKTGNLLLGSKSTVLDGIENTQTITNENTTDTTRISAEVRHVAVDSVKAAEQVKEATSALAAAKNELRDAKDRADRGELSQNAIKDYEANLAAATLNLGNAQLALGSTLATAAGTSATGGFTAGLEGEHSKTVSTDTQSTGTWQGTEINAADTTFVGNDFTIVGGKGNLGNLNIDNLNSLTLKSGTKTSTNSSSSKTNSQTASINTAGNVSLGLSTQNSSSQGSSTTQVNTNLNVDSLNGRADTTTINGGIINISGASEGSYSTDKLYIETVQNTSESSNKSSGANIGINANIATGVPIPTGGSLGANKANGNAQSIIAAEQSAIIDRGNKQSFKAGDTTIIGGIMANIQTDSEGNQSSGTLNFTTDTLTTKDITNIATNEQRNLGGSIGVGTGKQGQSINNVGVQIGHTANEFESLTKATIGQGAIVTSDAVTGQNSLAGVNRDPFNTEIIIKDQQTVGLDVDANIDARVFTHDGREEIIEEQKDIGKNTKIAGKITASSGLQAVATIGSFVQGDQSVSEAINSAKVPARMATVIANNPNVGAVIQAYKEGDYDGLLNSQEAIQVLVDSTGLSTDVIITTLTQKLQARGATNSQILAIDNALENRSDVIKIVGHEIGHDYGVKDEMLADLAGIAADLNVSASMMTNQEEINKYKVYLGDGKDSVTQTENKALLESNDETLAKAIEENPDSFDYDTDNWTYNGNSAASTNAEIRALQGTAKQIYPSDKSKQALFIQGYTSSEGEAFLAPVKDMIDGMIHPIQTLTSMYEIITSPIDSTEAIVISAQDWYRVYSEAKSLDPKLYGQMKAQLDANIGFTVSTAVIGGAMANTIKASKVAQKLEAKFFSTDRNINNSSDIDIKTPNESLTYTSAPAQQLEVGTIINIHDPRYQYDDGIDYGARAKTAEKEVNDLLTSLNNSIDNDSPYTYTHIDFDINGDIVKTDISIEEYDALKNKKVADSSMNINSILTENDLNKSNRVNSQSDIEAYDLDEILRKNDEAVERVRRHNQSIGLTNPSTSDRSYGNNNYSDLQEEVDSKVGTILTSSESRVNRTEELYQVDGVTYKATGADRVNNSTTALQAVNCSFRGDMMVKTIAGFKPIEQIQIGELVWSRNQITGLMSFNKVLQTISSIDPDTAYVTITDEKGNSQTIVSDSRHPYFGNYGGDPTPPKPSPEKDYLGDIQNAYWINAGDLEVGHKVLDDDGNWQTVTSVRVEQTPLNSYNLEVNSDHTFFIRGIGGLDGIWVHNKNCFDELPKDVGKPVRIDGKDVYTIKDPLNESKTVKVILNPDEAARARGEVYVEVIAQPRLNRVIIKQEDKPTTTYNFDDGTIGAERGGTGNWNRNLNKPLPNQRYKLDNGHVYSTDEYGRVNQVEANLSLNKNNRNENQQRVSGREDRLTDDHGGHLIASMFDGAGEGINLAPMNANFNGSNGRWYALEMDWKKALEKDGDGSVQVTIKPIYEGSSKRPSEFEVIQRINNGLEEVINLKNTPTGD